MEINGITIKGKAPELVGKFSGPLMVLGSGKRVFDDIETCVSAFNKAGLKFHTMAANLSFLAWDGPIEHLVSLHQNKLPHFYELSEDLPVSRVGFKTYAHCTFPTPMEKYTEWPIVDNNGTSSLLALKVAVMLGYEKIVCCGMDLEGTHRFYDNPNLKTTNNFSCDAIFYSWNQIAKHNEHFRTKVRGTSGRVAELFGKVSQEWLEA